MAAKSIIFLRARASRFLFRIALRALGCVIFPLLLRVTSHEYRVFDRLPADLPDDAKGLNIAHLTTVTASARARAQAAKLTPVGT